MEHLRRRTLHVKKVIKEAFSKTELSDTAEGTCDRYFTVTNSGRLARAATTTSRQQQHTVRSAKAATGKTGRTVSGKRSLGVARSDFPSQRRQQNVCPPTVCVWIEFHGGRRTRWAHSTRPSDQAPRLQTFRSSHSARGPPTLVGVCVLLSAHGSLLYPIEKKCVI